MDPPCPISKSESTAGMRGFWGIVIAQFLGAFNDNAFRWFLIALAVREFKEEKAEANVIFLSATLFLLPYILVSMHAGSLADRFSKRKVLMASKAAEALILALAARAFAAGEVRFTYLFCLLFLLGIQAAYYSPAKYGALPEILPEKRLSWGNGVLELTGFIAIITGTACGPLFLDVFESTLWLVPLIFASAALLGLGATWCVPAIPPAAPDRPIRINPLHEILAHGGRLLENRLLLLTLLGIVYIWSLGLLFQLNIARYSETSLLLEPSHLGYPMATVALGVGVGSLIAGYLSGKTIEIGLVPVGAVGTALAAIALYFTHGAIGPSFAAIAGLGIFAGFFIVPTHALLQEESADDDKGGIWAATNFLQTLGMLLAAGAWKLLSTTFGLGPERIFLLTGLATLAAAGGILWVLPESLGRLIAWVIVRFTRKVSLRGQEHLPAHGPILLLASGAPRLDAFLLLAGTRRFVRFLVPGKGVKEPPAKSIARWLKAIPLPDPAAGEDLERAFGKVEERLRSGEAVCVFATPSANGGPTSGWTAYRERLSRLMEAGISPVIPVTVASLGRGGGPGQGPGAIRRGVLVCFQPGWDRVTPADEMVAGLEDGRSVTP